MWPLLSVLAFWAASGRAGVAASPESTPAPDCSLRFMMYHVVDSKTNESIPNPEDQKPLYYSMLGTAGENIQFSLVTEDRVNASVYVYGKNKAGQTALHKPDVDHWCAQGTDSQFACSQYSGFPWTSQFKLSCNGPVLFYSPANKQFVDRTFLCPQSTPNSMLLTTNGTATATGTPCQEVVVEPDSRCFCKPTASDKAPPKTSEKPPPKSSTTADPKPPPASTTTPPAGSAKTPVSSPPPKSTEAPPPDPKASANPPPKEEKSKA